MKAVVLKNTTLELDSNYPSPNRPDGSALIRIHMAGICSTDQELVKGYMGFQGVLGHEFVGEVTEADTPTLVGQRVVGEINAACGTCPTCQQGLGRHCPHRSVLGILNHDGCMAEYCVLPESNLLAVPDSLPDEKAVFTEPLSAAYEILDQLDPSRFNSALVLGDGKLGILCSWVLNEHIESVTLAGHHENKLKRAAVPGLKTCLSSALEDNTFDLVVDATGSGGGISQAMACCRPRGTLVLKSTVADQGNLNLAPVVIDELTVLGSRCGRFEVGLPALENPGYPVERLVDGVYPLDSAMEAFEKANERETLKVLLKTD